MNKLSTDSYKGTRDWYPEDMRLREYVFDIWKKTAKSFGYEEVDAPILEPIEIYSAKSGRELVNEQTYQFLDRGDREIAIRPEMTPSMGRMVAKKRQELAYPARWFSVGKFMRYERPQKGREREFFQLNVDIFGADDVFAEAELILFGARIMKNLGADEKMYQIRVNNRKLINFMMKKYLGLDAVQTQLMVKLFDRKDKIKPEAFRDQAIEIFGENAESGLQKIAKLLLVKDIDDLPDELKDSAEAKEVQDLFEILEKNDVKNAVFDITLMRGLDYYTGTVFEFFDNSPENNRALFGGGRYDGLVGLFGAENISAAGFGLGYSTMEIFLKIHKLLPEFQSETDIYMVILNKEKILQKAITLADNLREENVNVEIDFSGRKIDKQIKTALKKKIPYLLFVGEDDIKAGVYNLKDVKTAKEQKLSLERIVSFVKDYRRTEADEIL